MQCQNSVKRRSCTSATPQIPILFYRGCSEVVESFTEEQKRLCGILAECRSASCGFRRSKFPLDG